MRRIVVENPSVERTYKTYLDSAYSSGTTLTVKSNVSFAANDLIVIGNPSEEFTELKKVSSVSGAATITLASALNFSHPKETSVFKVIWDNISIESKSSAAGTFSEITQSAIQWDSKTNETIYFDPNGTNSYQYRFRFYNSVTATYSEYSTTVTGATPSRSSVQFMIDQTRRIGNDPLRKIVSDDEIIRFFNRAQDIVYAHNPRYWFLLVDSYRAGTGLATSASVNVYSFANWSDFGHLDSLRYKYTNGAVNILYHLKRVDTVEFDAKARNLNQAPVDILRFYKLLPGDASSTLGYIQVQPIPLTAGVGTLYPNYYKKMTDLVNVSDTTVIPYPSILEDYAAGQIWKIRGNEERATFYESMFFGPPDSAKTIRTITGLKLLDDLDAHNRRAWQQPQQLSRFRGTRYAEQFFGNEVIASPDIFRENFF